MKSLFITITFTLILNTLFTQDITAQKTIEFFEGTLEELFITAKKENKAIFIDAYTNMCAPCKKMELEVFTQPNVHVFYKNFFINYKLDMLSKEGAAFAAKYGVKVFPTYLYFHTDGSFNHKIIGSKSPKEFIAAGKKGAHNPKKFAKLKAEYDAGNRDEKVVSEYLRQLWLSKEANNPVMVKTYKKCLGSVSLKEQSHQESIAYTAGNLTEDSYQLFEQNKGLYIQKLGAATVKNIEVAAAYNTVEIAIEKRDYALFNKIQTIIHSHNSPVSEEGLLKISLRFFEAMSDWKAYAETACTYLPKIKIENAAYLNDVAWNFYQQINEPELLQKAIQWASQSIEIDSRPYNNDTYSSLLQKLQS
ncbi:MAG: thioredoxin family protein [Chitinophagales bacterium]